MHRWVRAADSGYRTDQVEVWLSYYVTPLAPESVAAPSVKSRLDGRRRRPAASQQIKSVTTPHPRAHDDGDELGNSDNGTHATRHEHGRAILSPNSKTRWRSPASLPSGGAGCRPPSPAWGQGDRRACAPLAPLRWLTPPTGCTMTPTHRGDRRCPLGARGAMLRRLRASRRSSASGTRSLCDQRLELPSQLTRPQYHRNQNHNYHHQQHRSRPHPHPHPHRPSPTGQQNQPQRTPRSSTRT